MSLMKLSSLATQLARRNLLQRYKRILFLVFINNYNQKSMIIIFHTHFSDLLYPVKIDIHLQLTTIHQYKKPMTMVMMMRMTNQLDIRHHQQHHGLLQIVKVVLIMTKFRIVNHQLLFSALQHLCYILLF